MTSSVTSAGSHLPRAPPPEGRGGYNPVILLLTGWNEFLPKDATTGKTPLDLAVMSALDSSIGQKFKDLKIHDTMSFLNFADHLLRWVPEENTEGKKIYDILCLFAFVFDQPSLQIYQNEVHPKSVGQPLTWLSSWIVVFSQIQGQWLDTQASITKESLESFKKSPLYDYDECEKQTFSSFNDFFYRTLKPGSRPIAEPDNAKTIVFPADSTFDVAYSIDANDFINVKGLQWNTNDLLKDSRYHDDFDGGVWMHAFLNTWNYHRQHAPVAGVVKEAKIIHGAAYIDVIASDDGDLEHIRRLPSLSAQDGSGYQFLQTRGLIVIDAGELGLVAVLPIGMSQVSGIVLTVEPGQKVEKGDNLSYFKFGGSDIVVVFQPKAGLTPKSFDHIDRQHFSKVGQVLAKATPQ
ncbi:hypothetical protein K461DRAFT_272092 [Myriangium duriaei CBS 260.36]|uniref:Phosphatidylserine decarboxylase n=1 Tax=Myriangium duriaei CBS 260.36 TaxID=1168546 RepID=A0A9P4MG60_9PEZI|nr:hypothetical protein K461DRAFT_272092 [Myriangium duriaei CBS 260.36]